MEKDQQQQQPASSSTTPSPSEQKSFSAGFLYGAMFALIKTRQEKTKQTLLSSSPPKSDLDLLD